LQLTVRCKMSKWRTVDNLNLSQNQRGNFKVKLWIFPSVSDFDLNFLPSAICSLFIAQWAAKS
jgi:hypothetical protein